MWYKLKYSLMLIPSLLTVICVHTSDAGGLGGTVYVPNLHAKCLSAHQKRIVEDCTPEGEITSADMDCAEDSLAEYRMCEAKLQKLRKLDDLVPIQPTVYDTSDIQRRLYEAEHGGYPE